MLWKILKGWCALLNLFFNNMLLYYVMFFLSAIINSYVGKKVYKD